jgi:hypothetical protein
MPRTRDVTEPKTQIRSTTEKALIGHKRIQHKRTDTRNTQPMAKGTHEREKTDIYNATDITTKTNQTRHDS